MSSNTFHLQEFRKSVVCGWSTRGKVRCEAEPDRGGMGIGYEVCDYLRGHLVSKIKNQGE